MLRPKHSNSQIWSSLEQRGNVLDLDPLCILCAPTCFWLSEKISYSFIKTSKNYHIKSVWWLVIPRTECVEINHFSNNFTVCSGMWMSTNDVSSSSWSKHLNEGLCILQSLVWEAWKNRKKKKVNPQFPYLVWQTSANRSTRTCFSKHSLHPWLSYAGQCWHLLTKMQNDSLSVFFFVFSVYLDKCMNKYSYSYTLLSCYDNKLQRIFLRYFVVYHHKVEYNY